MIRRLFAGRPVLAIGIVTLGKFAEEILGWLSTIW